MIVALVALFAICDIAEGYEAAAVARNIVSNNVTSVANFYIAQTNSTDDIESQLRSLETKIRDLSVRQRSLCDVAGFYDISFSNLKDILVHAEWFLGIVIGLFGVLIPLILQIIEHQRQTSLQESTKGDIKDIIKRVDTIRDKIDEKLKEARDEFKELVSDSKVAVDSANRKIVETDQLTKQLQEEAASQRIKMDEVSDLAAKAARKLEDLNGVNAALEELTKKFTNESNRIKASFFFDTAKLWKDRYRDDAPEDSVYNMFRNLAQAIKYNVEANDQSGLNASIEMLQIIKNNILSGNDELAQSLKEKMTSFVWPIKPDVVNSLLMAYNGLPERQRIATSAIYHDISTNYGRC